MKELLNNLDLQHYDKIECSFQVALENMDNQLMKYLQFYQESDS